MIHIIGLGSIGKLLTHTLRSNGLAVNVLLRGNPLNKEIVARQSAYQLRLRRPPDHDEQHQGGIRFELIGDTQSQIETLLVCTKAYHTAAAIQSIKGRLSARSSIVLLNNGLGVLDEVKQIFDGSAPSILESIISHGVYTSDSRETHSTIVHAGRGAFVISSAQTSSVIDDLCQALQVLDLKKLEYSAFCQAQLRKVLVNVVISPLTAISGLRNGQIGRFDDLIERIIRECIVVMAQLSPPFRIPYEEARRVVDEVIQLTAENKSSMLQDVLAGRQTEIEYINGYIVREGQRHRCDVRYNQALVEMVRKIEHR